MNQVLVVGEALVDIVASQDGRTSEQPGGSPANVALGLARLGVPTSLLTRIGDDARGRAITGRLESSGVEILGGSVTASATSTATAVLDAAGVASYQFELDWSLPESVTIGSARALHTGSIAAFLQPGGDAVVRLLESAAGRATVSYDPNIRPQLMGIPVQARARVERIVAAAHVVKVSDEDLAWLVPGEDPRDVAREWLRLGPALVVVTFGDGGATGVTEAGRVDVPTPVVEVVDTVGAGDAFMSGLLDSMASADLFGADRLGWLRRLSRDDLTDMLRHAGRVAAFTCTRRGAQPPTKAELAAWEPSDSQQPEQPTVTGQ